MEKGNEARFHTRQVRFKARNSLSEAFQGLFGQFPGRPLLLGSTLFKIYHRLSGPEKRFIQYLRVGKFSPADQAT
jgi:hypothetical protein